MRTLSIFYKRINHWDFSQVSRLRTACTTDRGLVRGSILHGLYFSLCDIVGFSLRKGSDAN